MSVPRGIYCAIYFLVYPGVFWMIYILRVVPRGTDKFFAIKNIFSLQEIRLSSPYVGMQKDEKVMRTQYHKKIFTHKNVITQYFWVRYKIYYNTSRYTPKNFYNVPRDTICLYIYIYIYIHIYLTLF